MKICLINNIYKTEVGSGAERLVHSLTEALRARGHEVVILSNAETNNPEASYLRRLFSHIIGFVNISSYLRVKSFMEREKPDLIWIHNTIGFGTIILRSLGKVKKIYSFHDIQLLHPSGLLLRNKEWMLKTPAATIYQNLSRFFFPQDAVAIFPSRWLQAIHEQYKIIGNASQFVIKNPLRPYISKLQKENGTFVFLYLGQIEAHKGVAQLINAFASLKINARLIIAGNGSMLESLRTSTSDARVTFVGSVTNPEDYVKQANCLIIPSLCYENMPTALLEAMAQETPAIGSNFGGIKEVINDECLLFEPTETGIAQALQWSFEHKEELRERWENISRHAQAPSMETFLQKVGEQAKITF